jgi:hypothetical protein
MNINDAFPSSYIKAADLQGRPVRVTVESCQLEDLDGEQKPVLRFRGKQKGMVLNRVNAGTLSAALGDETAAWTGREIEIYPDQTMFQGRMVACLRLRVPQQQQQPAMQPQQAAAMAAQAPAGEPNDEIPW